MPSEFPVMHCGRLRTVRGTPFSPLPGARSSRLNREPLVSSWGTGPGTFYVGPGSGLTWTLETVFHHQQPLALAVPWLGLGVPPERYTHCLTSLLPRTHELGAV